MGTIISIIICSGNRFLTNNCYLLRSNEQHIFLPLKLIFRIIIGLFKQLGSAMDKRPLDSSMTNCVSKANWVSSECIALTRLRAYPLTFLLFLAYACLCKQWKVPFATVRGRRGGSKLSQLIYVNMVHVYTLFLMHH